jgi:hypothetical protein
MTTMSTMSTEKSHTPRSHQGAEPVHADISFEERDVRVTTIYRYLGVLAVAVILTYGVCVYILRQTVHVATQADTPPPPVRTELGSSYRQLPPEPRLQGIPGHPQDPQLDRRQKLEADRQALEKTQWLDQSAGIAEIPIEDAMRIIAEKGVPGATPAPSEKKKK